MGTLIGTLENVTEYSRCNGSERLKIDSTEEVLFQLTLERGN